MPTTPEPMVDAVATSQGRPWSRMLSKVTTRAGEPRHQGRSSPGVQVLELTELAQLGQATQLLAEVWHTPVGEPPVPRDLLRALAYTGGYVSGAYVDDLLVGTSVAFMAADGSLHSHVSGVHERARGRDVGLALKLHQRQWAIAHHVAEVTWTFDPLLRINAWFNLSKLGAVAREYLPLFYGDLSDGLNAGDESDRLSVSWEVEGPRARAAAHGRLAVPSEDELLAAGSTLVLEDRDGLPVRLDAPPTPDRPLLLRVPPDAAALRRRDPAAGLRWRRALREVLQPLLEAGRTVSAMTRSGCYVVTRETT